MKHQFTIMRERLFIAEDIEQHMAVLPEVTISAEAVKIDDIQIGDPKVPLTSDHQRLRWLIYKSRHFLMGKGNALLPAEWGAISGIGVRGALPIVQQVRPVAPTY